MIFLIPSGNSEILFSIILESLIRRTCFGGSEKAYHIHHLGDRALPLGNFSQARFRQAQAFRLKQRAQAPPPFPLPEFPFLLFWR